MILTKKEGGLKLKDVEKKTEMISNKRESFLGIKAARRKGREKNNESLLRVQK